MAGAQKGLIVWEQLLTAGIGRSAIARRVKKGLLTRRYIGVYLVGHGALAPFAEEMAAVLFHRGHAVLSHHSAAALWGFIERSLGDVTLTIVGRDRRSRPGMRLFRVAQLDRPDLRARHGLPVTSPARALIDVAAELSLDELEQALAEARVRGLTSERELRAAIERAPGRKGIGPLQRLLGLEHGPAYTHSGGERRLLSLIRAAELPAPLVNHRLLGYKVDYFWPAQRLVVELDGEPFHDHARAFERDRKRDQKLIAAGYRVIRITGRQLRDEPFAVIARIAQALGRD